MTASIWPALCALAGVQESAETVAASSKPATLATIRGMVFSPQAAAARSLVSARTNGRSICLKRQFINRLLLQRHLYQQFEDWPDMLNNLVWNDRLEQAPSHFRSLAGDAFSH